jgi:pyrroloquinoline quinone biosynthesis protein D
VTAGNLVPRVRPGVKCTWDHVRGSHVVLFPEGVLVLNDTAAAVVGLCDGRTDVDGIALKLAEEFDGVRTEDVAELVFRLAERGVVTLDG